MESKSKGKDVDYFKLNKQIAYKGKIGRRREAFCLQYTKRKRDIIKEIEEIQTSEAKAEGKTITCRKACPYSFCCLEYVDATVHECEAIVHFLYHNEAALRLFLENYPKWREKVKNSGDVFRTCEKLALDMFLWGSQDAQQAMGKASETYYQQKIPCPFLDKNLCSIYRVRPYGCAGYYVTTPLECCHPDYLGEVPVKRHLPPIAIADQRFYYQALEKPLLLCMPLAVHEIIEKGFSYLSTLPGLEGLEKETMRDKEVRAIYRKYVKFG